MHLYSLRCWKDEDRINEVQEDVSESEDGDLEIKSDHGGKLSDDEGIIQQLSASRGVVYYYYYY